MFDQSFSFRNFRRIYDIDRKNKGSLEADHFPSAYRIRKKINKLKSLIKRIQIKHKAGLITTVQFEDRREKINNIIEKRGEQYTLIINSRINEIVDIVSKKGYTLPLSKLNDQVRDKDVYTIGKSTEAIFVSKHIQNTLASLFNIKINHRDLIVSRLSTLVKDKSPKYIIRADVENFYESISHEKLLHLLHSSPKLSVTPRRIITQLIRNFSLITGSNKGLPRGIGLSAYLSEVYMNDVDESIRSLGDISYYERYVDDLIIIFSPTKSDNVIGYIDGIKKIVQNKSLKLNSKTVEVDLYNNENGNFEYLGYKFNVSSGMCKITLSSKKINKIRNRVKNSFDAYHLKSIKTPKKAYKNLLTRVKFLTGNTRLYNSKAKAFVGVYFSNKFITETTDLVGLDKYLENEIKKIKDNRLKNRLSKLSFECGFKSRIFRKFTFEELGYISKVWKNV